MRSQLESRSPSRVKWMIDVVTIARWRHWYYLQSVVWEIVIVVLTDVGDDGLGFTVVTRSSHVGHGMVYVKNVLQRGAAAKDGRLKPGDLILEVWTFVRHVCTWSVYHWHVHDLQKIKNFREDLEIVWRGSWLAGYWQHFSDMRHFVFYIMQF